MKDKNLKDTFNHMSNQELTFRKEDRDEVFEQLHKMEKNNIQKKSLVSISKKLAPLTAALFAVGLCLFLFIPTILQGNVNNENNGTDSNGVVSQEDEYFTTLFMVKDENDRIPINLLLTYNKDKNMMKVVSIPRDTYAPILDKNDGTTPYDKLSHAYINASGVAEKVRTTVSNLFDLPIDYYAIMDLETLSAMVDAVNGIEYDLPEDIRVRAISQVAFDFKKGTHRLNGEEVMALMMDATVGKNLDEEDQLNLINTVINQTINVIPQTQLKEFTNKIESNIPIKQLFEDKMELPSIESVSLIDGMMSTMIDESYYIKFEKDFLDSVSEKLTTFN
ncbi:LCP family protein [Schinkia azotoformans]|uniref:Cell envelope-related transcriptional attenuator n=1 Tax=Schinkia azotoformans LMG 9581 TaxID=1131731 RepID=K6BUL0_SCHAZ|nr:LCP family protein [Schinkia azotoformans]EKN62600.1 cell envelope-related transcriptional attenuator [Schinkia azotoformans LMG 9581]MEC1639308.1 LCP family protein [Schinkia azotoformans]MEC1945895.1 LCP family protein [Schinkia azotoformans]MED4350753.1 LCP family protein [Schinkia azotoformans]